MYVSKLSEQLAVINHFAVPTFPQVTSSKLVQTYIERIQEVNGLINALTGDCFASALREAAAIDEQIAQ